MKTQTLTLLLQAAGILHVGLICAGMAMPRVVNLRAHVATLPPFVRQLFWVYYSFIGLCLVGFGTISVILANQLASGSSLARGVCLFLFAFWTVRLVAATMILDVRPYLKTTMLRVGYQSTNIVFVFLPLVYLFAALKGGR
ncbi:MAG TPA: hypothetical protein VI282_12125 [Verrucomicrobiae bacterium]|jgi:hypothetical protein